MNILNEGGFFYQDLIFPKERFQNMHKKNLKVVTFVRPAEVYIEDGKWKGIEVCQNNRFQ